MNITGDLDTNAGQDAAQILGGTCKWTEKFYDMYFEKGGGDLGEEYLKEYVKANSQNSIVYIEYNYVQLGQDEKWLRRQADILLNNPVKIAREIFLKRMKGSDNSPFEAEDLMALNEKVGEVIEEHFIMPLFKLDVYKPIRKDKCYIVGGDISNGYGLDNTAVTVIDPYAMEVVADFKSPFISVTDTARFIRLMVKKLFPRAIICCERNMNGESVIRQLCETDVRHMVYFDNSKAPSSEGIDQKLDAMGMLKREAQSRRFYGVYTQRSNRVQMFTLLEKYMHEKKDLFVSPNVIDDINKLVIMNGKVQAGSGFHDDCIMSLLICLYVYHYGSNLSRYGFYKGEFLEDSKEYKEEQDLAVYKLMSDDQKQFFGDAPTKSINDQMYEHMKEMQKYRRETTDNSYTDFNSGGKVRVSAYDDEEADSYTSLGADFFSSLNS